MDPVHETSDVEDSDAHSDYSGTPLQSVGSMSIQSDDELHDKDVLEADEESLLSAVRRSRAWSKSSLEGSFVQQEEEDTHGENEPDVSISEDDLVHSESVPSSVPASTGPSTPARKDVSKYDEEPDQEKWSKHKKHIFILSNAGKPIFSRYGDEGKLSGFMGVISALISRVQSEKDDIHEIYCGEHRFVFVIKGPLYLVMVSRTNESRKMMVRQLEFVYSQIISILSSSINRIFDRNSSYDLRTLLGGTDNAVRHLIKWMNEDPSFSHLCVMPLRIPKALRSSIGDILSSAQTTKLQFAILFRGNRPIQIVRPKKRRLHPVDLLLCMNLVNSSLQNVETTFTPICLPQFNDRGFCYAYIGYIAPDVCLMLVSASPDDFEALQQCREHIVSAFSDLQVVEQLEQDSVRMDYTLRDVDIPALRHFLYCSFGLAQISLPKWEAPYHTRGAQKRLLRLYGRMQSRMYKRLGGEAKLRTLYMETASEATFAVASKESLVFATFAPLTPKDVISKAIGQIKKWIKKDEENCFILQSPVWQDV